MDQALWRWSAVKLAEHIRAGDISSREAVESALGRLEEVNPQINAVVDILAQDAREAADRADDAVRKKLPLGLLHGVPVTAKINVDFAGRATTSGVEAFRDRIASVDSPSVANWRKAGAVFIGRTNVPAFCTRYFSDNSLHGRTLNPWDASRTPGGSSGGAAAAVATGIGALAHGSDRAGSVRYPAYACGVVGIRPSFGRVPQFNLTEPDDRGLTSQITGVQGVLARSIGDVRLGLHALAAGDPRDPWWTPGSFEPVTTKVRVGVLASVPGASIDAGVTENVRSAARLLRSAGYEVEEIELPHFEEAAEMFWKLAITEEGISSTKTIERLGDAAVKRARAGTVAYASGYGFEDYIRALSRRATILRAWQGVLATHPALLLPSSWQRPFPVDLDQQGDEAMAGLLRAQHPLLAVSVLGLPALAVPTGLIDGVPIGVQLVAGRFREEKVLALGEVLEKALAPQTPIDPGAALAR